MAPQVSWLQNERGHLHGSPGQSATKRDRGSLQNNTNIHLVPPPPPSTSEVSPHKRAFSSKRWQLKEETQERAFSSERSSWRRKHKGVGHTTSHYYVPCQPVPLTINLPCTHLAIKKKTHTHTREKGRSNANKKHQKYPPLCQPVFHHHQSQRNCLQYYTHWTNVQKPRQKLM